MPGFPRHTQFWVPAAVKSAAAIHAASAKPPHFLAQRRAAVSKKLKTETPKDEIRRPPSQNGPADTLNGAKQSDCHLASSFPTRCRRADDAAPVDLWNRNRTINKADRALT